MRDHQSHYRYDASEFLHAMPADGIRYFHLAGHFVEDDDLCIDNNEAGLTGEALLRALAELWKGYTVTDKGFGNFRIPLLFIAILMPLLFKGAGKLSLDQALARRFG